MKQPDDEFRARFSALRHSDRTGAPSFRETRDAASRRATLAPRWRPTPLLALAAAAGVVLVAGLVLRSARDRDAPSITTWTSPTAGLLRTPGVELLGAPPALRASILDRVVPAPVTPRGH